ncbi:sucrose synthase [Melioribacter roseus P3M-2]|uniref:Sucrose synthase n=1 Tax=Melioribacter roseus (strain DSM 23840 / JCM 17771 / VKM B-2668 / P3M-2) TaxID=1191523 RepID=SUS_MELRP|nr:sucrose synthase [Melioribacter roseus]I7A3T6.1 RecName: Full=Sucrose synthase; Short=SuSyMr [Melioribacter roseus P3M-2]AFN74551.1 sucrose synthase [Melioribacter roseus P3M-2]AKM97306.1 sucrose synthase SuSyMr [synthetic construct]
MIKDIYKTAETFHNDFYDFLKAVSTQPKKLMITGELINLYVASGYDKNSGLYEFIEKIQETISLDHSVILDVRIKIASIKFYRISLEEFLIEEISSKEFLIYKETVAKPDTLNTTLNLNFKPFYDKSPAVRDIKYIGSGVEYLNRFLSSQMFTNEERWKKNLFDFIRLHNFNGEQLILNDRIKDTKHLNNQINAALAKLGNHPANTPYENIKHILQELGFEKGLGKDAGTITHNLNLLDQLLNSPDHNALAEFISSIPMILNIAIISPHGFFGQEGVLGLPDTGGQVVYILDQVKALEKQLIDSLKKSGLNLLPKIIVLTRLIPNARGTTCNQRLEKIYGAKNSWILRVPFREYNKRVTDEWISRFEIWPYLEDFAEDSYTALLAEFKKRPDLIIGNYSDGNLVAYLLAKKFKVTQCGIAHALEKSKYLYSALYWYDLEKYYHFSMQFTADLLAINSADFLITSSFQEIAGTEKSIGQYESYMHFTMPGLYRVENGVNPFHVKFNIVSPGVNEKIYFPYPKTKWRLKETKRRIENLFFSNSEDPDVIGWLDNPEKTPIFTMSRLDRIKNISFLVRCFGESEELQQTSNLIVVAGKIDETMTDDYEEKEQIRLMHELITKYKLHNKIRWIGKLLPKDESGEAYRIIAERRGIFVQPALFEGFGLTVLEAMTSGLPVFATKYGGPLEIIQNGVNGFHIDPVNQEETTEKIVRFLSDSYIDSSVWDKLSKAAIKRVTEKYSWKLYSKRLLSLAKLYGFWKYATNLEHEDINAYLDLIYHTIYKSRAKILLEEHMKR